MKHNSCGRLGKVEPNCPGAESPRTRAAGSTITLWTRVGEAFCFDDSGSGSKKIATG